MLGLLLFAGARLRLRETRFWWPVVGLGLAMWGIYGLVNIEERYVTVAYFAVLLPVFAALEVRAESDARRGDLFPATALRSGAGMLVVLLAFLALGETLRVALQQRREQSVAGLAHGWQDPRDFWRRGRFACDGCAARRRDRMCRHNGLSARQLLGTARGSPGADGDVRTGAQAFDRPAWMRCRTGSRCTL